VWQDWHDIILLPLPLCHAYGHIGWQSVAFVGHNPLALIPWLYTGDLGCMDDEGYLSLVDRKTDLIKTSGYQVWPREIEDVIAAHPAVADVGVAGVPDPVKGEGVPLNWRPSADAVAGEVAKAWVVLRPGTSTTAGDIRAYCREHLAPYKVPAAVELRDALPKTLLVGKVLRRKLVEESANGQQAEHRP
jgi:long-chain acyl-CoA synthetase